MYLNMNEHNTVKYTVSPEPPWILIQEGYLCFTVLRINCYRKLLSTALTSEHTSLKERKCFYFERRREEVLTNVPRRLLYQHINHIPGMASFTMSCKVKRSLPFTVFGSTVTKSLQQKKTLLIQKVWVGITLIQVLTRIDPLQNF